MARKNDLPFAVRQALASSDTETGCTIHLATPTCDCGQILAQAKVPIRRPKDTEKKLHARIQKQEHRLYPKVVRQFAV